MSAEEQKTKPDVQDVETHPVLDVCRSIGMTQLRMKRVRDDYYDLPLEQRAALLGAPSIHHLCKTILLENQKCINSDCSDPRNSRFYCIVLQYSTQLQSHKIFKFVRTLIDKAPQKNYHFRYAKEQDSDALTGYSHNAVTPFGLKTQIPIILSKHIMELDPPIFWLGGGEVDTKLEVSCEEFNQILKPYVTDVIIDAPAEGSDKSKEGQASNE
ncbi:hypothetical protein PROFUN_02959 [Planoprotostelium fungivorum]|uniref:YbaK/aminoacyl-tRNA synthetase-associated domain-containing protein n=1 Tax=Planoprotostelium fungivorum TaxID=1890364 RepID=A0A2P6NXC3_9EUKA|nr:hypothetical protein PROFUN_02959 [Planoprotostelium fungivorum]